MSNLNRRKFIAGLTGTTLTSSLAGCSDRTEEEEPREVEPPGPTNELEDVSMTSIRRGSSRPQLEVDISARELTSHKYLVVQLLPIKYYSPELEIEDPESITVDTIRITEFDEELGEWYDTDEIYKTENVEINLMDYWDDIPDEWKRTISFTVRVGIETENDRDSIQFYDHDNYGVMAYTHKENGEETKEISNGNLHSWVEDDKYHIQKIVSTSTASTKYNIGGDEDFTRAAIFFEHKVDIERMEALRDLYNRDDPERMVLWHNYLEPKTVEPLGEIEYLESPIFRTIAEEIERTYNRLNLTDDDELYIHAAYRMASVNYDQPWDDEVGNHSVEFPEVMLERGGGDCKAQGCAVNGILHHLGYDTSLSLFRKPDAPDNWYHHLGGGVGIESVEDTTFIENTREEELYPDKVSTDDRVSPGVGAEEHLIVDPSTANVGRGSDNHRTAYSFKEGKS